MHDSNDKAPKQGKEDELEHFLLEGLSLTSPAQPVSSADLHAAGSSSPEEDEDSEKRPDTDIQGSLGLFAEASQDMATAGVELSLGRHFACVDFCNQAVEKAAQAVSLRQLGRRSPYNHDLRALGAVVGAPKKKFKMKWTSLHLFILKHSTLTHLPKRPTKSSTQNRPASMCKMHGYLLAYPKVPYGAL